MRLFAAALATFVTTAAATTGCHPGPRDVVSSADSGPPASQAAAVASPANALPLPSASVEAQVNPWKLPAYDGPTGSVEGTVFVSGPSAPDVAMQDFRTCPAGIDTYGKLFRAGPANAQGLRPLADAVVAVTGYSGYYLPDRSPSARVTITANCGYPQRAIAMTFGQRLEIANDSRYPFAPYLDGTFQPAIMIAPPGQNGDPVKLYPPGTGHFFLLDRMQSFVSEDLYVLRHPLHAVTDLGGHYRIDGVPATKVKVGAILNAIRNELQKDVDVRPHVVETIDLVLIYSPHDAAAPSGVQPPGHVIP
jgi:hypothetical protein